MIPKPRWWTVCDPLTEAELAALTPLDRALLACAQQHNEMVRSGTIECMAESPLYLAWKPDDLDAQWDLVEFLIGQVADRTRIPVSRLTATVVDAR